jgi:acetyl-CoA hydrolase
MQREAAARAAELIEDGDCLQVGIGTLPDLVLDRLAGRRDLGIHSGLMTDKMVELRERGAVTNRFKPIDTGLSVATAAFGTRRLYDALGADDSLQLRPASYTHAQATMTAIPGFVAVNGALQIDLSGQINAERADGRYVGAVGGQVDFMRGAAASTGGRSVIVLPATAAGGSVSRIVASLEDGPVTTARSDVDLVVTEHGVAALRGLPMAERALRLIAIAAPQFRNDLAGRFDALARRRDDRA